MRRRHLRSINGDSVAHGPVPTDACSKIAASILEPAVKAGKVPAGHGLIVLVVGPDGIGMGSSFDDHPAVAHALMTAAQAVIESVPVDPEGDTEPPPQAH